MPLRQMLAAVTSAELAEYMAFDQIEPIGEPRADLRAGILASAVVNHSMNPPKQPTRPTDFMPFAKQRNAVIKLGDAAEHGQLLAQSLFGTQVKKA
jgi:hypothetical protein